jgi:sorbitol/mannitol transport system permease protein
MTPFGRKFRRSSLIVLVWVLALAFFFPLLYMLLTGFKSEAQVVPPRIIFKPTLVSYGNVITPEIGRHLFNSFFVSVVTTIVSLLLGVPAAYVLVFGKMKKPENLFFWFLSTNLLPPVGVVIPIYLMFKYLNLLDTRTGLILVYLGFNIPLAIWMVRSFMREVPYEVIEASYIDGASKLKAFFWVILPLIRSGLTSTALLVFIFAWNEFFFAINLTYVKAATMPVYMAAYMTQEGLFWAKLSAIATIAILPPLIAGWLSQKSLVRGLTFGAVKG